MNWDMIWGLLRQAGVVLLTYLVSTGKLTDDQASALIKAASEAGPALAALGLIAYGAWKKRDAAKVKAAGDVDGATVHVDTNVAAPAVVKAALDRDVKGVVPMVRIDPMNEGRLG